MGKETAIEWCHHTFNVWIGCSEVSGHPGCGHCYARELMQERYGRVKWGPNGTRSRTSDDYWRQPLAWDRAAKEAGERRRVFCASLADVFEDWRGPIVNAKGERLAKASSWGQGDGYMPTDMHIGRDLVTMDDLRRDLFALIDQTPNLDWLLLTKRPENIRKMWTELPGHDCPRCDGEGDDDFGGECGLCGGRKRFVLRDGINRPNVWLGTSISNQQTADKQIPELLKCRDLCSVLFLSCEPLLGPIQLCDCRSEITPVGWHTPECRLKRLDWTIVGGESGHGARPMDPNWARDLRDQCQAAGAAFFMKQWGEYLHVHPTELHLSPAPVIDFNGLKLQRVGKKAAGRMLDGREHNEFPEAQT